MEIVGIKINHSAQTMAELDAKLQVVDCSKDGHCSDCGQCCGNMLPVNFQEIERIRKYIRKHNIQPCQHFAPLAGYRGSMLCPFRDNTAKRCTIYPVRPSICKSFFCGKTRDEILTDRAAAYKRSSLEIDMRATFFGGDPVSAEYMRSTPWNE